MNPPSSQIATFVHSASSCGVTVDAAGAGAGDVVGGAELGVVVALACRSGQVWAVVVHADVGAVVLRCVRCAAAGAARDPGERAGLEAFCALMVVRAGSANTMSNTPRHMSPDRQSFRHVKRLLR